MDEAIAKELEQLKDRRLVSGRAKPIVLTRTRTINVGVTFRTDGNGKAHTDHDLHAIECMNNLKNKKGGDFFPFKVVGVTLPRGAKGGASPLRVAQWSDLDDIHLLYIPGAPTANDTQESTTGSEEERDFARVIKPKDPTNKSERQSHPAQMEKYNRLHKEHSERSAYELSLLGIARQRGIPILAICAGSWRLLECYGGKVRTLEITSRNKHKAEKVSETWNISHGVKLHGGKTLIKMAIAKGITLSEIPSVNSTHWAVASTISQPLITLTSPEGTTTTLLSQKKLASTTSPHGLKDLEITAWDPDTDTVEAFESLYGAPTMGIQWHPECYLPGMMGEKSGSKAAQELGYALFEFMGMAACTSMLRGDLVSSINLENQAFLNMAECITNVIKGDYNRALQQGKTAKVNLSIDQWTGRLAQLRLLTLEVIALVKEGKLKEAEGSESKPV